MDHDFSKKEFDLAVAYRIYPGVSKTPFVYKDSKLKLAELGVRTLKQSLGMLRAKIFFILDNCPPEFKAMILQYFSEPEVEFVKLQVSGNLNTFGVQIDILLAQNDADFVFFAEDDYLYRPRLLEAVFTLFSTRRDVDFVTPYDHLDSYSLPIHTRHKYELMLGGGLHWRTSASTCLTFFTRKETLRKTERVFRSYCHGVWDSSLWYAITKFNVFNLKMIVYLLFHDMFLFKTIALSWMKLWRSIIFGNRYKLWQPVPSIATHLEEVSLAPNIDWHQVKAEAES